MLIFLGSSNVITRITLVILLGTRLKNPLIVSTKIPSVIIPKIIKSQIHPAVSSENLLEMSSKICTNTSSRSTPVTSFVFRVVLIPQDYNADLFRNFSE